MNNKLKKNFTDFYEYSSYYRKLMREYNVLLDLYDKSSINIHTQDTKDSDPEFDNLLEKQKEMASFRLSEYSERFNQCGFGFFFIKQINNLKKENPILDSDIRLNSDELVFKFIINDKTLLLEFKNDILKLKHDEKILYLFNVISLDEKIYHEIFTIIPQIKFYDKFIYQVLIEKVKANLITQVKINKESLITCIQVRAYDIKKYKKEIKLGLENKLNLIFDFSYFLDNHIINYNKINTKEKIELKNLWINLFQSLDWNTDKFIQLKNPDLFEKNTYEELEFYPVNIAKFHRYNMIFLIILIQSYCEEKTHIVKNYFSKFLLYYFFKNGSIKTDKNNFLINKNDYLEVFDDSFWWFEGVSFFPGNEVLLFIANVEKEDVEKEYKLFKESNGISDLVISKRNKKLDFEIY